MGNEKQLVGSTWFYTIVYLRLSLLASWPPHASSKIVPNLNANLLINQQGTPPTSYQFLGQGSTFVPFGAQQRPHGTSLVFRTGPSQGQSRSSSWRPRPGHELESVELVPAGGRRVGCFWRVPADHVVVESWRCFLYCCWSNTRGLYQGRLTQQVVYSVHSLWSARMSQLLPTAIYKII